MKKLSLLLIVAFLMTLNYSCKKNSEDCVCIEVYQPVCGNDGKQYNNSCKAECAGVTFSEGFCEIQIQAKVIDMGSVALDGCDWVIQFEVDGVLTDHHPIDLPTNFEQDQLEVNITYKPTLTTFSCGLLPTLLPEIELINIEEL